MIDLKLGDLVYKNTGDYTFRGIIVAVFQKLGGEWRVVVENTEGILMILNERQLVRAKEPSRAR